MEQRDLSLYLEWKGMVGEEKCVRALIHPVPSDADFLLIVRISYNQRNKRIGNTVFDLFRPGECPNRLVPKLRVPEGLGTLLDHEVSFHHHQNTKAGNALTSRQTLAQLTR